MSGQPLPAWLAPWRDRFLTAWQQGRAPQGVLLAGPAGVGKRLLANWLVRRWICAAQPNATTEPCGLCRSCQLAASEVHPDAMTLAPEAPQREIVIDQVRALIAAAQRTAHGERRAALVVPAEAMNRFTANALLKVLEEPPANLLFVLVSDAPGRLLPTILSRVQRWLLPSPPHAQALAWLTEQLAKQRVVADAGRVEQSLALYRGAPLAALDHLVRAGAPLIEAFVLDASERAWRDPVAVASRWAETLKGGEKASGWGFADLLCWYRYWLIDLLRLALVGRAWQAGQLPLHFPAAGKLLAALAGRQPVDGWWQRLAAANRLALWTDHALNLQAQCEMVWLSYVEGVTR